MIRDRNRIIKNVKTKIFYKLSQTGPGQEVEKLFEFFDKLVANWGGSVNTKPLQFGVQSDDYANNGGYDDSDNEKEKFMENGNPPVDPNGRSDEWCLWVNLANNFEKITEEPNRSNKKVWIWNPKV